MGVYLLTCARLCAALYYIAGFPVKGMPEKCYCADEGKKTAPTPLVITLKLPKDYKSPEPLKDDRPKIEYEEDAD